MCFKTFDEEYEVDRQEHEIEMIEEEYKSLPKLVFKYKALDTVEDLRRIIEIFTKYRIYMPNYKKLNDPLEGTNSKLLGIEQEQLDTIREKWQILSLSADCLLPTLWAYYSGNYTGVCLGFKTHNSFDEIKKVSYINRQLSWTSDLDVSMEQDLQKKSEFWKHENEWRLVRSAIYDKDDQNKMINSHFEFKPDDIRYVLVGYLVKEEIISIIKTYMPTCAQLLIVKPAKEKFCLCAVNPDNNQVFYSVNELL